MLDDAHKAGVAGLNPTFRVLGADYLAEQGYLEEVWDPEAEGPGRAAPWPVVDILDDGRIVARRVPVDYFSRSDSQRFQPV